MNLYLPSEAVSNERRRFLDWRLVASITVLALVAFLVYAGWRNYNARDAEAAQKAALITELSERAEQIEDLQAQLTELQNRAADTRKKASRERNRLLRLQERMLKLLRAEGIEAPASMSTSQVVPVGSGDTSEPRAATRPASTPKTAPPRQQPRPRQPRPEPTPAPQPAPSPEPEPGGLLDVLDALPIL